jgi:NhaA family Na+:H+ antiporter
MADLDSNPPESWAPARRAAAHLLTPLQRILAVEATSGLLLVAASVFALAWANSPWHAAYEALWHTPIGARIGDASFVRPLAFWINDGLMTIFFFVVGLEIRRELHDGELAELRRAALPVAAALGGMIAPAVIYAALNLGRDGIRGWGVPMATDIAFAVGVLTLLGKRVPPALRTLLLALAVIDDIGAIVVIALFYGHGGAPIGFALSAVGIAIVLALRAVGMRAALLYVAPSAAVWIGLLLAGVHPTIAGVVLGLLTPVRSWFGPAGFARATQANLHDLDALDRDALLVRLTAIEKARREAASPVDRLQHVLHPWVAYGVMPVFALANAGIALDGASLSGDGLFVFLGIVLGLAVGKPLGIFVASAASTQLGLAARGDLEHRGIALVGVVGGIGFTMSLFIAQLAFPPGPLLATAKLAIIAGSATSSVVACALAWVLLRRPAR